jgi:MFS family permease
MANRWGILAVLFAVRATMGFQFQSVPAVAPLLSRDFGVGLADIGLLIGLYLAPGIVVALPGGAIGRKLGDKSVVVFGLMLMMTGGALMALMPTWGGQVAGRLIAGVGGVFLNVLMSKMVTDWFASREIATAMAVFVNSWPVGVALALVILPPIADSHGSASAFIATAAFVGLGLALLAAFYISPSPALTVERASVMPHDRSFAAVLVAGAIWSVYNSALIMIFGFGPSMLAERGWKVESAGTAVSIVLWLGIVSVPLGGLLADWIKWKEAFLVTSLAAFAVTLLLAARIDAVIPSVAVLGFVCGLPAGAIMGLPSRVLLPTTRAAGMGLFFTMAYIGMFAAPAIAGRAAAATGSASTAFDCGAAMLFGSLPLIWLFQWLATPPREFAQYGKVVTPKPP